VSARLDCPLCGAVVVEGADDIAPGACPGCGARYEGGEGSAPDAVAAALVALGATDLDPAVVTDAVFRLSPADSAERGVAITSDERDDFYRWWLFVRSGGATPQELLAAL
jgi:hypothetical protein